VITHLPYRARAFAAAIIGAGTLILVVSLYGMVRQSTGLSWLVVAGLAALTGSCMVKLPRIETRFSLSDALVFTTVVLLGPACAALVAAVDALAASLRFNKRDNLYAFRTMFNMTAAAVSIWFPAHVFLAAGGPSIAANATADLASLVRPLAMLVAGYSLLNTGAIAGVIALTTGARVTAVWRENFAWVWVAHAWSGIVAGVIAIYIPHVNVASLVVILAVAAIGYATVRVYLGKVEESTGRLHKLNELYLATIKALALAIDAKDQVTHGHIRRVQFYAVGLARAMGVSDEPTLKGIEAGALLHDTGKIAVPEHILNKPGKLNAQEYERMKSHVTIGADILSGIDFPYPVIPYVRHHHENWDGTGYPDGLKGDAIPLGARILSVVDCFDALTSDRPYRRALTTDASIAILRERSGNMYDPAIVEKFIEIYPALTEALEAEQPPAAKEAAAAPAPAVEAARDAGSESVALDDDLEDLPRLAGSGLAAEEVAFVVANRLKRRLRFVTVAVYVPRAADDRLEALLVSGRHADLFRHSAIRLNEGLSGWVAAHGQFIVNANPALDLLGPVAACDVQLSSALVVPFAAASGARGTLALYSDAPDAFTLDHARMATAAAVHLSRALRVTSRTVTGLARIYAA
jgi:putative nucleotidyltransferase with HDIG domain